MKKGDTVGAKFQMLDLNIVSVGPLRQGKKNKVRLRYYPYGTLAAEPRHVIILYETFYSRYR